MIKTPYTECHRGFHPGAAPHFVPLRMLLPLTYNESLTFCLLYVPGQASHLAKNTYSSSLRQRFRKSCKDKRGFLRLYFFPFYQLTLTLLLSYRCFLAKVFNTLLHHILSLISLYNFPSTVISKEVSVTLSKFEQSFSSHGDPRETKFRPFIVSVSQSSDTDRETCSHGKLCL